MNAVLTRTLWDANAGEADDLNDRAAEGRTYVGLRRPHGWQLLVITSAATTVLWDGAPTRGRLQLVVDEASSIANALLEDLAQCRPPLRARAALARRIRPELAGVTFVFQGHEVDSWLLEQAPVSAGV